MAEEVRVSRWAIGLAITVMLAISAWSVAGLTWGGRIGSRVEYILESQRELKGDMGEMRKKIDSFISEGMSKRYTSADATQDKETVLTLVKTMYDKHQVAIDELKARLDRVQNTFETRILALEHDRQTGGGKGAPSP